MSAPAAVALSTETFSDETSKLDALIAALDPEVRAAIDDVDLSLIDLALAMSPWERLGVASRMARSLARLRDAAASQRG